MAATAAALVSSRSLLCWFPLSIQLYTKSPFSREGHIFIRTLQSSTHQATTTIQTPQSVRRQNIVDVLEERGLLESITSENLRSVSSVSNNNIKVYCGFDPTAESLHLGNLIGIIVLSWFQRLGHKAFALIGGATARIGDPSGKSIERPELDIDSLEKNISGISDTLDRIFNINVNLNNPIVVLNNYDWWKDVKLLDFLKQVGRFARVGTMIGKESVKKRLESEQGMSYTEFTYQLLQGYDFVHLFNTKGINVEIGGSDQWGNITAGTELIRKILQNEEGNEAYGLTFPLLLKSDGTKFGKSEDGAIWLSPAFLSPYKFYQYFFTILDDDIIRFLKILTFLDLNEIAEIERKMKEPGYVPNTAQRRLAEEVTRFVHGEDGLNEARKATEALRPGAETKLAGKQSRVLLRVSLLALSNMIKSSIFPLLTCRFLLVCLIVNQLLDDC